MRLLQVLIIGFEAKILKVRDILGKNRKKHRAGVEKFKIIMYNKCRRL